MPRTGTTAMVDPAWLRAAYLDDKRSIASLAAETGMSKKCISANLRELGVTIRHGRSPVSAARRTEQYHEQQRTRDAHVWGGAVSPVADAAEGRCHIYLLLDPNDHQPRYVGQSVQPQTRHAQHLRCRDNNHRKNEWVKQLATVGAQPLMIIVATCAQEEADRVEADLIDRLRGEGADLFNQYAPARTRSRITLIPIADVPLDGIDLLQVREGAVLPSNVLAKIDRTPDSDCWLWTGATTRGYGVVQYMGRVHRAHRVVYTCLIGAIPDKHVLDHDKNACGNRACVYPGHHLEPVTNRINILRGTSPSATHAAKTHCIHGHEFTPENTRIAARKPPRTPERQCLTCEHIKDRARAKAKKLSRTGATP